MPLSINGFDNWDINKDKKLNKQEMEDSSKNEQISSEERLFLKKVTENSNLFEILDVNQDGTIDIDELKAVDKDSDGNLSINEQANFFVSDLKDDLDKISGQIEIDDKVLEQRIIQYNQDNLIQERRKKLMTKIQSSIGIGSDFYDSSLLEVHLNTLETTSSWGIYSKLSINNLNEYDSDKDGKLSMEEIQQALKDSGLTTEEKKFLLQLKDPYLFNILDEDKDGYISLEKLKEMDLNENGKISKIEKSNFFITVINKELSIIMNEIEIIQSKKADLEAKMTAEPQNQEYQNEYNSLQEKLTSLELARADLNVQLQSSQIK